MITFADLLDDKLGIRKQLEIKSRQLLPAHLLKNLKSLLYTISEEILTIEKRVMHEMYEIQETY